MKTARKVLRLLKKYYSLTGYHITIGTVESATGGRIANEITNVPGSSEYYAGSIVSYSNRVKTELVKVNPDTIDKYGAVSNFTAIEMAKNGLKLLGVDICISDTGIAGPTGQTPNKPLGLFYIGLSSSNGDTIVKELRFTGSRIYNKKNACEQALILLNEYLKTKVENVLKDTYVTKKVVSCFIKNNNNILIVKRSTKVGSYQLKWSAISGYVEQNLLKQALTEIYEETGLTKNDLRFVKRGKPVKIYDIHLKTRWIIYPFLFETDSPEKIRLDWENTEVKWISPDDIQNYDTVPGLAMALNNVSLPMN